MTTADRSLSLATRALEGTRMRTGSLSLPRLAALVLALAALVPLPSLALPTDASAQAARSRPTGSVQGLDLQLEGALHGPRGGTLRWLVTAYEVQGMSTLRLAPDTEVQLTTSLDPAAEPRSVRTDAHGRALVELPIPATAPASFGVVVRALRSGVTRRFELTVQVDATRELVVRPLRLAIEAGSPLPVGLVARDVATGAPLASLPVRLELRDGGGRPLLPRVDVTTDASGLALHTFAVPASALGSVTLVATSGERDARLESQASVAVRRPSRTGSLDVAVAPSSFVVEPGSHVDVEVVVRTAEGRPVEGATLEADDGRTYDERRRAPLRTDARGHAHYRMPVPQVGAPYSDYAVQVSAAHEFEGRGVGAAGLRIARIERAASFAVEGGALVPSLGGRVYARVVEVNGAPSPAGVAVELTGPRIGRHSATTDASGIAVFDVPALASLPAGGGQDRCGGEASTALDLHASGAEVLSTCLALDPDAQVRVRLGAAMLASAATLDVPVTITRTALAAGLPVALRAYDADDARTLAAAVLAPAATSTTLTLPTGTLGRVVVVARVLVGPEAREARGGAAQLVVLPGAPFTVDAALEPVTSGEARATATPRGTATGAREALRAFVVALPLDELEQRRTELEASFTLGSDLGSLRTSLADASPALVAAALAVTTPRDTAAPFVLRGNAGRLEAVAVPAPTDPMSVGLLRDPWRAESRFLTGRLALLFRAIEQRVASAVPEHIEDVAVESSGRWDFNAQIVASVAEGANLGAEGATGLGGEPITVEALRRFDAAFTYDNVARRITRERLFRLLVALRRFVHERGYDIPWARLGDPTTWLAHTTELYDETIGQIGTRELVDAWGHPFVLAPVRGRPRYGAWQPLEGWEVFSTGPDGRANTGDDLFDPTARVLPSASPYAQSVGEDGLVARLSGVELGRATVIVLGSMSGAEMPGIPESADSAFASVAQGLWDALPPRFVPPLDPLALDRPTRAARSSARLVTLDGSATVLPIDEEPRSWGLAVLAISSAGARGYGFAHARLGSPLLVEAELPSRVRDGESLESEVRVTNASARALTLTLDGDAEGPLTVLAPSSLTLAPETSSSVRIRINGTGTGHAHGILRFLDASSRGPGASGALRTLRAEVDVDRGLHPIRTRAGFASASGVDGTRFDVSLEGPSGARDASSRVVVLAPSALGLDPDLAELRERDPGLVAWSLTMAGRPLDERLRTSLLRASSGASSGSPLSQAAALVAWSAADPEDQAAQAAAASLRGQLALTSDVALASAVVAALAPGGAFELADTLERSLDPVAVLVARERAFVRRTLAQNPSEPSLLARAAAALLVADPGDAHGRAMYERARSHVERFERGGRDADRLAPSASRDTPEERLAGSLALALAASQLGDHALAERLFRGAAFDDHLITSRGGELLFWWLACGAYGVLGASDEASTRAVRVESGGRVQTAELASGVAVVELAAEASPSASVRVDGAAFVRVESLSFAPYVARHDGPLTLRVDGERGDLRHVASLELVVHADELVREPIVFVELPSGVRADDELLASMSRSGASAELRTPGLVRLRLPALAAGSELRVPLPLVWQALGASHGLTLIGFEASRPDAMTVVP